MRYVPFGFLLFMVFIGSGCVSDKPSDSRIREVVADYYKEFEAFNCRPTEIKILEVTPTGERVLAVVNVEGQIVDQYDIGEKKRFARVHKLTFQWRNGDWECTGHGWEDLIK